VNVKNLPNQNLRRNHHVRRKTGKINRKTNQINRKRKILKLRVMKVRQSRRSNLNIDIDSNRSQNIPNRMIIVIKEKQTIQKYFRKIKTRMINQLKNHVD